MTHHLPVSFHGLFFTLTHVIDSIFYHAITSCYMILT
jgi:hypothetical protein